MKRRATGTGVGKMNLAKESEIQDKARHLCGETHFNQAECEALLKLHTNLISEVPMDRMQFRSLLFLTLEISETFILDRIFRVVDQNGNEVIDGDEFVRCLSVMMRGTIEEHISFCYDVYDVNGDRSLAREELFMCLDGSLRPGRGIVEKEELSDCLRDIVELMMRKLDVDKDGQITFEDFRTAILNEPLLVQCLGQCLPPKKNTRAILYLVTTDDQKLPKIYFEAVPPPPPKSSSATVAKSRQWRVVKAIAQSNTIARSVKSNT